MFVNSGPEHPASSFVLSSYALSYFPVIESVLPKFIRAIVCFRPLVLYIVLFFSFKDASGPATISFCISEGSPGSCRSEQSAGDSILWHCFSFMEVAISGDPSVFKLCFGSSTRCIAYLCSMM